MKQVVATFDKSGDIEVNKLWKCIQTANIEKSNMDQPCYETKKSLPAKRDPVFTTCEQI